MTEKSDSRKKMLAAGGAAAALGTAGGLYGASKWHQRAKKVRLQNKLRRYGVPAALAAATAVGVHATTRNRRSVGAALRGASKEMERAKRHGPAGARRIAKEIERGAKETSKKRTSLKPPSPLVEGQRWYERKNVVPPPPAPSPRRRGSAPSESARRRVQASERRRQQAARGMGKHGAEAEGAAPEEGGSGRKRALGLAAGGAAALGTAAGAAYGIKRKREKAIAAAKRAQRNAAIKKFVRKRAVPAAIFGAGIATMRKAIKSQRRAASGAVNKTTSSSPTKQKLSPMLSDMLSDAEKKWKKKKVGGADVAAFFDELSEILAQ